MRPRFVLGAVLGALCMIGMPPSAAVAATNFNVDAAGMLSYLIDGAADPTLTLTRGQTYTFTVVTVGHPFWITTAPGAGDAEANAYAPGVTNNGAAAGRGEDPGQARAHLSRRRGQKTMAATRCHDQ
jgi:hypothetical protein